MNRRGFIGTAVAGLLSLVLPKPATKDFGTIMGKPVVVNPKMTNTTVMFVGWNRNDDVFDLNAINVPCFHKGHPIFKHQ